MGGGGKWGGHTSPPTYPHPKSSSNRTARGPQEAAKLIQEKKAGAAGAPPGPHLWGLAKKKGGEWGLEVPTPAESPDPREGGCSPSLGSAGNVGGHRGEKLFPPSAFLLLPRSLIPSCPYPYRQWQTVPRPSSRSSAPCPMWGHHRQVPGLEMRCAQSWLGRGPS